MAASVGGVLALVPGTSARPNTPPDRQATAPVASTAEPSREQTPAQTSVTGESQSLRSILGVRPHLRRRAHDKILAASRGALGATLLQEARPGVGFEAAGDDESAYLAEPGWLLLLGTCLLGSAAALFRKMKA